MSSAGTGRLSCRTTHRMSYLRHQRLELVAELLRDPEATLDAAAARVGFSSAFALSATFKRECGVSPSAWRAAHVAHA